MVSNGSSEGLPPDWTVQFNALKTGRKVKYYVNLETGQKFMSKDEVLHCVRRENAQVKLTQGTEMDFDGVAKDDQIHVDRNTNEHPEWLPSGWVLQLKSKLRGQKHGETYKCFVDLSSGHRCYSKPQVLRYLKTEKHKRQLSQKKETLASTLPESNATAKKTAPKDLPPGWIKEYKIRKKANGIRRDPYYTAPVTGYIFRSRRDVWRYVETGEISKYAILPKKRHIAEDVSTSPSAKRRKLDQPTTRQICTDGLTDPANQSPAAANPSLSETEAPVEMKGEKVSSENTPTDTLITQVSFVESKETCDTGESVLTKANDAKRNQGKNVVADNLPALTPEAVTIEENFPERSLRKDSKIKIENSRKSDGKVRNWPFRSSRRLAGLQPELVASWLPSRLLDVPTTLSPSREYLKGNAVESVAEHHTTSCLVVAEAKTSSRNESEKVGAPIEPVLSPEADIMQEQNASEGSLSKANDKIRLDLPSRSSKQLTASEPELVSISNLQADAVGSVPPTSLFSGENHLSGNLINHGAESKEQSNTSCLPQPKANICKINQDEKVFADNAPSSTLEADVPQQSTDESGMRSGSNKIARSSSMKSYNKKGLNLPRRTSKRLSRLEPELLANSVPNIPQLQNVTRPGNKEADIAMCSTLDGFEDEATKHLKTAPQTKILHHPTDWSDPFQGEPPKSSQKPLNDQAVPIEELQDMDTRSIDGRLEQPTIPPEGHFLSDPCIEFAFKTIIGEIPVETAANDTMVSPLAAGNEPIITLDADILQKQSTNESGRKRSSKRGTASGSRKSYNKKGLNLPCRSSKRLAGLEPALVGNSLSSIPPFQNDTGPGNREATLAMDLTLDGVKDEASKRLKTETQTSTPYLATDVSNPFQGQPSNTSQKPLHEQAVPSEQSQDLETVKINNEKPEPPSQIGKLLSDPCIEFAFKTLTGAIPVENLAANVVVSTPAADIMSEKSLPTMPVDASEKFGNSETPNKSRKSRKRKELDSVRQSSKRITGAQPHPMSTSGSSEYTLQVAAEKSSMAEAVLDASITPDSVDEASRELKGGLEASICHGSADVLPTLHVEPSNESAEPLDGQIVIKAPSSNLQVENIKFDKIELQPSFAFGDFWSDPWPEFAFKTLTGAISVDDYLPIQGYFPQQDSTLQSQRDGYFQQQVHHSQSQTDGYLTLPDFGLPCYFQTDISAHFDTPEKQPGSLPQLPSNKPLLPAGNVSLPSCISISSQQSQLEGNKGLSGKVKS